MAKIKASSILEIVANKLGYSNKSNEFNLSEWYGFLNNEKKLIRLKFLSASDKDGNYNIHIKNDLECDNLHVVIQEAQEFNVFKLNNKDNKKTIKYSENNKQEEYLKKEPINLSYDNTIYESQEIEKINDTIYGIMKRVDDEIDIEVIKNLFEKGASCAYCGIKQDTIDKLDIKIKGNNQDNEDNFGLTSRNRGKKLEVDQIEPKKGYIKDNVILCCYWCNNAKSDTFIVDEFKPIAKGINEAWKIKLNKVWKDRGADIIDFDKIQFWKEE